MNTISPAERRSLKARAHALRPLVIVSGAGLTDGVVAEIDRCLNAHELIKIRIAGEDREQRESLLARICERTGASAVQHIGKVLVVYRENPGAPPEKAARPPAKAARRPRSMPTAGRRTGTAPGNRRTGGPARSAGHERSFRPKRRPTQARSRSR